MKIVELHLPGGTAIGVDSWLQRGIIHGFLGSELDAKKSHDATEAFLSKLCGRSLSWERIHQTHSDLLAEAPLSGSPEADACTADFCDPNMSAKVLGILTADCSPILIISRETSRRAAVHCGWRGAQSNLLGKTLDWFIAQGERAADLELALGPSAGQCCYEVGEELIQAFSAQNTAYVTRRGESFHFDLNGLLADQAVLRGVPSAQICNTAVCTICTPRFFSYRREKSNAGRQLSFIGGGFI